MDIPKPGDGGDLVIDGGVGGVSITGGPPGSPPLILKGGDGGSVIVAAEPASDHSSVEQGVASVDDSEDELVSLPQLAKRRGLSNKLKERLRKRLETWRKDNFDGGWIEARDPKPHDPRYLYPAKKVAEIAEATKASD